MPLKRNIVQIYLATRGPSAANWLKPFNFTVWYRYLSGRNFFLKNEKQKKQRRSIANILFFFCRVATCWRHGCWEIWIFIFSYLLGYRSIVDESVVNEAHSTRVLVSIFSGNRRIVAAAVCRTLPNGWNALVIGSRAKPRENHHLPTVFHLCTPSAIYTVSYWEL